MSIITGSFLRLDSSLIAWLSQHSLLALLLFVGTLAYTIFLTYRLLFSPVSKIPGPWYTKVSGLPVMYHDYYGSKRLWIHNLHLRYGHVVRLSPTEVCFASTTALREIYIAAGGYVKTELYDLFMQENHRNMFTILDKKQHNERKRHLADRYNNTAVLQAGVQAYLRERAQAFAQICAEQKTLDVYLYLHCFSLDCVTIMVFHPHGTRSMDDGADHDMVKRLTYEDIRPSFVFRHYFPQLGKLYQRLSGRMVRGGRTVADYAWSTLRKTPHSDFTLATRLLEHPEIDEADMVAECLDHLAAGIETTGDTLCFLMWELSQPHNVTKVQRLRGELRTCDPSQGNGLDSLPYLNAVIEEAMRLWAPGTGFLPRRVPPGGRSIDGCYLPGDTIVGVQSYTMHRWDQHVFPEPDKFLPERWLEEKGSVERQRWMFGFGAGARTCVGKFLALSEMKLLLHAVYSRFQTRPAEDMHASMEMEDTVLTSRPKDMFCKLVFEPLE